MDWNETMPWSKNIQKHVLTYFKYIFQQIPAQGCFNVPMLEATSISGHQILWPRAKPVWIVWIAMVAPMCRWFNMLYRFYPLNMRLSIATLNNVMVYYIYIHVCLNIYIYKIKCTVYVIYKKMDRSNDDLPSTLGQLKLGWMVHGKRVQEWHNPPKYGRANL